MSDWTSLDYALPPPFVTVLTQHVDDLYPAVAFRFPNSDRDDCGWWRSVEGPEDGDFHLQRLEPLLRKPTHWMALPLSPAIQIFKALEREQRVMSRRFANWTDAAPQTSNEQTINPLHHGEEQ